MIEQRVLPKNQKFIVSVFIKTIKKLYKFSIENSNIDFDKPVPAPESTLLSRAPP
jgi:hypothetical protein